MATLDAALRLYDGYSETINQVIQSTNIATYEISQTSMAVDNLNINLGKTGDKAASASAGLKKVLKAGMGIAKQYMKIADAYMNTAAGLESINDGSQTQAELQDKVFAAADRANGSYASMAASVKQLGMTAEDAFPTNDEAIAFVELVQKSMKIGGVSEAEQGGAMMQLSQTMGKGTLTGDQFSSIAEKVPLVFEAVSKYMGKSGSEVKKLASDGVITADIIKNAMFGMSNEINGQFEAMDMTFGEVWNKIKNAALKAFGPIIEKISTFINSPAFMDVINIVITGLNILSLAVGGLIDFLVGNWPIIRSILLAIGMFLIFQLIGYLMAAITVLIAHVALWWSMNTPILAVIGTILLIINALMSMGVTFEDIFGFIGGVVGVAVAGIWNLFVGLFEFLLGILNFIVNPFINLANFIGNVFSNPVSSIVYLFQGMADTVLGIIEAIANTIDAVFGSNLGETVSGWRTDLKNMADKYVAKRAPDENYQKLIDNKNWTAESFGIKRMDYKESWNKGESVGKSVYSDLSEKIKGLTDQFTQKDDKGTASNPTVVKGFGSGGKVDVNMATEDLKYLRDIAEREYINKFSTATLAPNVQISFGDVHETADMAKLKGTLEQMMREEIAVAAEGVF
ncbi:tape measure domain-containing protein [Anaerotaenia torta]|uniref:tape measure protein n=1 Tax=Anaerotaenia torta TaxID=433293 RepID=UPI003D220FB4